MSEILCRTPDETFDLGAEIGRDLRGGDVVLLYGDLGAGKTLLTKGILHSLEYDTAEVTSPSFTLVNLYRTAKIHVYHIDLWRLDSNSNAAEAVGLDEILERGDAVVIVEWADRLGKDSIPRNTVSIRIAGDGDEPRRITIEGNHGSGEFRSTDDI